MLVLGEGETAGFWSLCIEVLKQHGVVAILLIAVCFLFYKLIWKVWNRAMDGKDAEIERLVKERDKYHELFFARLLSSEKKESPEKKDKKP